MISQWWKEIGVGLFGVALGLIPISGNIINAYTTHQVQNAQIKSKIEMLETGQKEILKAIDALRTDKRK